VRKQSTIHQIRKRMRKKQGQSSNGSEYSVENWNNVRQNQSEFTSQNSLQSQTLSIRQKNQVGFLDQMILENQAQSVINVTLAPGPQNNDDGLTGSEDTNGKLKGRQRRSFGLHGAQNLGSNNNLMNSLDVGNQLFHSNTPQFNYESFIRATSRSSYNDELISNFQQKAYDKDKESADYHLIHNLVDDPVPQLSLSHPLSLIGINSHQMKSGPFSTIEDHRSGVEIIEDDNESQASSEKNKTIAKKKTVKINVENVSKEEDQDSFKSSISSQDEVIQIPLN